MNMKPLITYGVIIAILAAVAAMIFQLPFVKPEKIIPTENKEAAFFAPPVASAKVNKTTATGTDIFPTKVIDWTLDANRAPGGVCYKLTDISGDGVTFIWAKNGTLFSGLACE